MKRKSLVSLLLVVLILVAVTSVFVACNKDKGEMLEYSVKVTLDNQPVSGITVNWSDGSKIKGSATTGEDGQATVNLVEGNYYVDLAGYAEGLTYTQATATPITRKFTMKLSVARTTYTVTVIDKDGNPAIGAIVSFLNDADNQLKGTATTGADGKASCELDYGTYKISLDLEALPENNVMSGSYTVSQSSPNTEIRLVQGNTARYSVTVKSQGGLLFKNEQVLILDEEGFPAASGYTNDKGVYSATLEAKSYSAEVFKAQDGYTFTPVPLTDSILSVELVLSSSPISVDKVTANTNYVIGDIIHDYTFKTSYYEDDGETVYFEKSISQMLAEGKKAIIINNWGTKCTYCVKELPAMQTAYNIYGDRTENGTGDIEIIGLSNYLGGDSIATIESYVSQYGYTFPMMRDPYDFVSKFGITGWPLTIVIDRYGAIARIETGAIMEAENWGHLIEKYIDDDYEQDFVPGTHESESITTEMAKPDIKVPDNHYQTIAETINASFNEGTSVTYYAYNNEYAWPFLLDVVDGISENGEKVLYASNYHRASSFATICATVTVPAGKVFTFDYYSSTEEDDILSFVWDGKIVKRISGKSEGWQTCHLYVDLVDGTHTLTIAYVKDESGNSGKDTVYLKNVRFTEASDIQDADMLRSAAYGNYSTDTKQFAHYAGVELLESDGYYHVKLNTLENNGYAGGDTSPMLLINLLDTTNWDNLNSLYNYIYGKDEKTGEFIIDCTFTVNGVNKDWRETLGKYLQIAGNSDINGYLPVDKDLHDLIVAFIKRVAETRGTTYYENEWLEACYFYSHYGTGDPVGNPILGVTEKTALPVELDAVINANLTRLTSPFPFEIYYFVAPEDGLYMIQSLISPNDAARYQAQAWLYDDNTIEDPLVYDGAERFIRDGENEHNFTIYRYMHAGEKYYIQLAFIMQEMGHFDFSVTKVNSGSATVLLPTSLNTFTYDVDEKGNKISDYYLAGAIEYVKGNDGFYHVKNPTGVDDFIYLDVKYMTAVTYYSITQLLDQYQKDPYNNKINLSYKVFDFRYAINYFYEQDANGELVYADRYDANTNITNLGAKYKDYTQIIKDYIADPANAGPEDGLVKVNQTMVDILTLFIEVRINALHNDAGEKAYDNEWLRLCWYYRTYDVNHN